MNAPIDLSGVRLETDDLILRPFEETDLEDLYEYARVPGVGEMAGWAHHKSMEESKEVLAMFIREKKTLAVVEKRSGKVIGSIGIETYSQEHAGEEFQPLLCRDIGYALSKDYWGKGLMPRAVKRALNFCFDDLGLDAVFCGYFKRNHQSRRVNEKIGFQYICDRVYTTRYGTQEDGVFTVMRKKNWQR